VGVSRQSVHAWLVRYRAGGLAGLGDRSRRPRSSPNQASPEVEARVCELRRGHPKWGAQRILHELMRGPAPAEGLPSRATVHRILVRHGLVVTRARRRKRSDYVRWQRPAAMQLWQLDVVYGPRLVDTVTGELREGRVVTGVDDHSRYCVLARVVSARPAGPSVWPSARRCSAMGRRRSPHGQRQAVHRSLRPRRGVLFEKICRRNGIAHRLTAPRSPTTTGKIERFHQALRRELLDDARPFTSLLEARTAVDDWVREYNAQRPHQSLERDGAAIEVDRAVNNSGLVSLAGREVLAAEILDGRPVIVRIEPQTLMFLDPQTRELLRVRPSPLAPRAGAAPPRRAPGRTPPGRGPSRSPFSAASAPPA
jgi:transposase InsO family protein